MSYERLKSFSGVQTMGPLSSSAHSLGGSEWQQRSNISRSVSGPIVSGGLPLTRHTRPPKGPMQIDEHLKQAEYHERLAMEREKENFNGRRRIKSYIKSTEDARKGFVETNKHLKNPTGSGWVY